MNKHSKWRLGFARNLKSKMRHTSGVQAIMVGGSVARGYADPFSDLEVIVYWNEMPPPELRRLFVSDLEGEYRYPKMDIGHESALLINGFPVDLWHKTVAAEEAVMNKVINDYSIDLDESNVLDTIRFGIPLQGEEMVQSWKNRAEAYPEELAMRYLKEYLPHFHLRQLLFAVERDNVTAFYSILSAIQSSLFVVLLALNRAYFPTFKWMYKRLEDLPITPDKIGERLKQMYSEPPRLAAGQLHGVLSETLALVKARYPELDTEFAQYGLDQLPPKAYERLRIITDNHKG